MNKNVETLNEFKTVINKVQDQFPKTEIYGTCTILNKHIDKWIADYTITLRPELGAFLEGIFTTGEFVGYPSHKVVAHLPDENLFVVQEFTMKDEATDNYTIVDTNSTNWRLYEPTSTY